ncbi:hypothetical protein BBJ28_00020775 [Nothophytophthora sp. Chile5]|nr:hypothetical protein BBJ28_00020775 [Nothophytophthora sp. Chile5]
MVIQADTGTVTFYLHANYGDVHYKCTADFRSHVCYNLVRFDNKISSVKWSGLPPSGRYHGHSKIAFFTDNGCKGTVRAWPTVEHGYPSDLELDGIDNQMSSFAIWTSGKDVVTKKDLRDECQELNILERPQ